MLTSLYDRFLTVRRGKKHWERLRASRRYSLQNWKPIISPPRVSTEAWRLCRPIRCSNNTATVSKSKILSRSYLFRMISCETVWKLSAKKWTKSSSRKLVDKNLHSLGGSWLLGLLLASTHGCLTSRLTNLSSINWLLWSRKNNSANAWLNWSRTPHTRRS